MDSPITTLGVTTLSIHRVAATLEKLISRVEEPGSPSLLTEELSRRLCLQDPAFAWLREESEHARPRLLCEARHDELAGAPAGPGPGAREGLVSRWRQKERLKTTAVALVVCLNIGVDPPDVVRVSPCARTECWIDPLSMPAAKALDAIGKSLQVQYERWQPRAKYKMHLDPTTEDVKKLATSSRRAARGERVLFHYNGHGVPRPTANGEIWVFNRSYTQYIPLSLYDLQTWLGTPAIYVFDCSTAGQILHSFKQFMAQRAQEAEGYAPGAAGNGSAYAPSSAPSTASSLPEGGLPPSHPPADPMRSCILLCACGEADVLPQTADLPADLFTACLTTPIKVALRWFWARSAPRWRDALPEEELRAGLADRVPGKQTDRKTPLGELNWVFTAITDTIAWNVLPRALFQRLFRQDLLVASLFRNFLLADRVMRAHGCTPVSHPRLPPTHQHAMWQAWDMAAEACLLQLPAMLAPGSTVEYVPSPFFSEQLTAFELWLEHGSPDRPPPEQLPIVLQVLLSQVHRLRALVLLGRFLDMGSWAVDLALSVGIFPYVLKLLQTTAADLRATLVFIWAKIMAWDANPQVQGDLVKDGGHVYFVKQLDARGSGPGGPGAAPPAAAESRAQAAFVLAALCDGHPRGQLLCAKAGLLGAVLGQMPQALAALAAGPGAGGDGQSRRSSALLVKWLALVLGKALEGQPALCAAAMAEQAHDIVARLLASADPEVRGAACFALGALIQVDPGEEEAEGEGEAAGAQPPASERWKQERAIACSLMEMVYDASPVVRGEVACALGRLASGHGLLFQAAVAAFKRATPAAACIPTRAGGAGAAASAPAAAPGAGTPGGVGVGSLPIPAATSGSVPLAAGGAVGAGQGEGPGEGTQRPPGGGGAGAAMDKDGREDGRERPATPATPPPPAAVREAPAAPRPLAGSTGSTSSPGVRARGDAAYEPALLLGLGGEASDPGGPPPALFASPDAARVGGGLYAAVLDALCTLSTDPAPGVAAAGLAILRRVGVELVLAPAPPAPAPAAAPASKLGRASPAASPRTLSGAQSTSALGLPPGLRGDGDAPLQMLERGASLGVPRAWQPRTWRGGGGGGGGHPPMPGGGGVQRSAASAAGSAAGSPSASPPLLAVAATRPLFFLRQASGAALGSLGGDGGSQRGAPLSRAGTAQSTPDIGLAPSAHGSTASLGGLAGAPERSASLAAGAGAGAGAGWPSPVYAAACEAFTWPLLAPQAIEELGPPHATWLHDPSPELVKAGVHQREAGLNACRGLQTSGPHRACLQEGVHAVDTGSQRVTAVMLDALRPLLVTADGEGWVRVSTYNTGATANAFHLGPSAAGAAATSPPSAPPAANPAPAATRALFQLNEAGDELLLACAADGSVRVWRDYSVRGAQRLATAWQAALLPRRGRAPAPAVFAWAPAGATLVAAGGGRRDRVFVWDVAREACVHSLHVDLAAQLPHGGGAAAAAAAGSSTSSTAAASDTPRHVVSPPPSPATPVSAFAPPPTIDHLAAPTPRDASLVYVADSQGGVRIFDLRTSVAAPVAGLVHLRSRLAGLAVEPGGAPHQLVLGYPGGSLAFADLRAGGSGGDGGQQGGVWKVVEAHSKPVMAVLAGHPHAPLLATATTGQVVKVWSPTGDPLGVIRAHTSFLSHRPGPITCLAWAPYDLHLASGGQDRVAAVYHVGPGGGTGLSSSSRPPAAPSSSIGLASSAHP